MFHDERVRGALGTRSRFGDVRFLERVDSTNRYVREAALAGAAEGLVVVADFQEAGRGRLGRTWEAPPGSALLVSILLRVERLRPTQLHLVTAAVAMAARDACVQVGGFCPDLKWPNDLLVGERKLAGILAESVPGAVVVGLGLNVASAPPGAICADEAAGRAVEGEALLIGVLRGVDSWYGRWDELGEAYRGACATVGRPVRVDVADGSFHGRAESVDADGRLVVRRDDGVLVEVSAADVVHVRPSGPGSEH